MTASPRSASSQSTSSRTSCRLIIGWSLIWIPRARRGRHSGWRCQSPVVAAGTSLMRASAQHRPSASSGAKEPLAGGWEHQPRKNNKRLPAIRIDVNPTCQVIPVPAPATSRTAATSRAAALRGPRRTRRSHCGDWPRFGEYQDSRTCSFAAPRTAQPQETRNNHLITKFRLYKCRTRIGPVIRGGQMSNPTEPPLEARVTPRPAKSGANLSLFT